LLEVAGQLEGSQVQVAVRDLLLPWGIPFLEDESDFIRGFFRCFHQAIAKVVDFLLSSINWIYFLRSCLLLHVTAG
jgi:hypothetical protein